MAFSESLWNLSSELLNIKQAVFKAPELAIGVGVKVIL